MRVLIRNGANITLVTSSNDTALHFACGRGYRLIVQELIEHGADIYAANADGRQCIHEAAANGFYANLVM